MEHYSRYDPAELAKRLERQVSGIDKILKINSYGLVSPEDAGKLRAVQERADALIRKLRRGEYEIAIVGLEKAGKSTFANALMRKDILPTKPLRCTYTTTSIRWDAEDHAQVAFFRREEFTAAFQANLQKMGIPHADSLTPASLSLEDYQREFEKLDEQKKAYYRNSINEDIETILKNYAATLCQYVGAPPLPFSGREQITSPDFRRFIEEPAFAIAVREITIYSSRLDQMRNAVIYDVPGFDSPTEMHKAQTRDKLRRADAILLVTDLTRPSFTGPSLDMFRTVTDDDGLLLGDKLFVFANRADMVEDVPSNLKDLEGELRRYRMLREENFSRVVAGSAKGCLQAAGILPGREIMDALAAKGRADGVEEVYRKLTEYNRLERAGVLERRAGKVESDAREILEGLAGGAEDGAAEFFRARSKLTLEKERAARNAIRALLEKYRSELMADFSRKAEPLTKKLRAEVVAGINADKLGVTDEELDRFSKSVEVSTQNPTAVDVKLREYKRPLIYNAFRGGVIRLAVEEHRNCESRLEDLFAAGLGLTPENSVGAEVRRRIRAYIESVKGQISSEGYYDSLVFRFSDDVFNILLQFSFGDEARFHYFMDNRDIFYSLSMFDRYADPSKTPDEQPLIYQLLFHEGGEAEEGGRQFYECFQKALALAEGYTGGRMGSRSVKLLRAYAKENGTAALPQLEEILRGLEEEELPGAGRGKSGFRSSRRGAAERDARLARQLELEVEADVEEEDEEAAERTAHDLLWYKSRFLNRPSPTYESVKAEINRDIDVLHDVLENTVVPAVCIETPFLSLERGLIRNLLEDMDNGNGFLDFLSENMHLIAAEEYRDLEEKEQKRGIQKAIRAEIRDILDEMDRNSRA